jgi:hypothetical protein
MNIPEWASVLLVTAIAGVIWWGVLRLVKANDDTAAALGGIYVTLKAIDGRLIATETWKTFHDNDDVQKFKENNDEHKELWHAVNKQARS